MRLSKKLIQPETEYDEFMKLTGSKDVYTVFEDGQLIEIETDKSNLINWAKAKGLK